MFCCEIKYCWTFLIAGSRVIENNLLIYSNVFLIMFLFRIEEGVKKKRK